MSTSLVPKNAKKNVTGLKMKILMGQSLLLKKKMDKI